MNRTPVEYDPAMAAVSESYWTAVLLKAGFRPLGSPYSSPYPTPVSRGRAGAASCMTCRRVVFFGYGDELYRCAHPLAGLPFSNCRRIEVPPQQSHEKIRRQQQPRQHRQH